MAMHNDLDGSQGNDVESEPQSRKVTYCLMRFTCRSCSNTVIEMENRTRVARSGGMGERVMEQSLIMGKVT